MTHDMREADTILRELVALRRSQAEAYLLDRPGDIVDEARRRERLAEPAWAAAFAWADAQKAPQPRTASEQPVVACVIDLDGHDYLCWKAVAAETYSDKPQRDLIYATPQPESLVPINCNRQSERPCPECHIQPGETCDICGAAEPAPAPADEPPTAFDYAANKGMAVTKEWCRGWDDCRAYSAMAAKLQAERSAK
jgi:hypothetical protein